MDLAFASMTPAVNERGGIERMCRMSRSGCFITTFTDRTDAFMLQAAELAALQVPERVREETGRHEIMMDTVRSLGYEPELTVVDYNWENLLEPDEALQRFFNGRTMELEDTPDNRRRIRQAVPGGPEWLLADLLLMLPDAGTVVLVSSALIPPFSPSPSFFSSRG